MKEFLKVLKKQKRDLDKKTKEKQQKLDLKIQALQAFVNSDKGVRMRRGIHIKIKELIKKRGPLTLNELTDELESLSSSDQPRSTIYHALRRRTQDFIQLKNKKWDLKENVRDNILRDHTGDPITDHNGNFIETLSLDDLDDEDEDDDEDDDDDDDDDDEDFDDLDDEDDDDDDDEDFDDLDDEDEDDDDDEDFEDLDDEDEDDDEDFEDLDDEDEDDDEDFDDL